MNFKLIIEAGIFIYIEDRNANKEEVVKQIGVNKYGLKRSIPSAVKRAVRQKYGFGCVICGKSIIEYDHFEPEFTEAKSHDPDGIVILCIEHHGLKSIGRLSNETILKAIANPKCKESGFSYGAFDTGSQHPEIVLGELYCRNTRCLINLDGEELLSVMPPLGKGDPFRLNAEFRNDQGDIILRIVENEWMGGIENWDLESVGRTTTIRNSPRKLALVIRTDPPNKLVIERLDMKHKGYEITCREGGDMVIKSNLGGSFSAYKTTIDGFDTAIMYENGFMSIGRNRPRFPRELGSMGFDITSRVSRNSRCPCDSGKRFKRCHGFTGHQDQ